MTALDTGVGWGKTSYPHRDVEHVTAEKSEWNTVAYVCNIYKDYIGCRLVMEDRAAHQEAVESVKSGGR